MESSRNCKNALVRWVDQFFIDVLDIIILEKRLLDRMMLAPNLTDLCKSGKLVINCPYRLLYRLFESPTNAHHLTDTLHAATKQPANTVEFFEIPSRDLDHNIIKTRLKARTRDFRHRVFNFIQRNAETQLCCNEGERITCGLGC